MKKVSQATVTHAEWHVDMLREISDIFTAAITNARMTAEIKYGIMLNLEQQRFLEIVYGENYTQLIMNIVCDAAKTVNVELPGCNISRNTDKILRYEHVPTQQVPSVDMTQQETKRSLPVVSPKQQLSKNGKLEKKKP